ncbi:hypothetical protein MNBD_GAMMA12-856 [hydrothermal vent metagenome]|uniref:DUF6531 domain-containing protein n=1 Tax=hydrothermal vent metagenome TaxID=652676 RepID=A0A3B0Z2R9_9ZZZZ
MTNKFRSFLRISFALLIFTLSSVSPSAYSCGGTAECDTWQEALNVVYADGAGWAKGSYDWCTTAGQECVKIKFYARNAHPDRPVSMPNWTLWRYSVYWGAWLEQTIQFIRFPTRKEKTNGGPFADSSEGQFHGAKSCNLLSANSNGANSKKTACSVGNPINIGSGNKYQQETDISGSGKNIKFQRFYNSQTTQNYITHMGKKWSHTYSRHLIIQDELLKVLVRHTNKKILVLTYPDRPAPTVDPDIVGKFTAVKDTAGAIIAWEYRTANDSRERYDLNGRLVSIRYLNGNIETFTYDASNRLLKVTNSYSYTLSFAYDPSNRMSSVTDQAGRI